MNRNLYPALNKLHQKIDSYSKFNERYPIGIVDENRKLLRCRYLGGELTDKSPIFCIPSKLEKLLYPKPRKIVYGGRSGCKTTTVGMLLAEYVRSTNKKIVGYREIRGSIRESLHKAIADSVYDRNLEGTEIDVLIDEIRSKHTRGRVIFKNLHNNPQIIKGDKDINIGWVDEAETITEMSWETLIPTVAKEQDAELWVTFNPRFKTDPTWRRFVLPFKDKMINGIYEDDFYLIIESNWRDNPWLSSQSIIEKDILKKRDPDRYWWVWEGQFNVRSNSQIFHNKWKIDEFEPTPLREGPFFGADWGFANDPDALIRMWLHDETLFIDHEMVSNQIDMDKKPEFFDKIDSSRENTIYADCSRPETISYLYNNGYNIEAAPKWSGSVEDGIVWLRGLKKIVIHPRCKHTAEEFELYSYKIDKLTDEPLPIPEDKYNHCIDAIRYGMSNFIQSKKSAWDGDWMKNY